MNAEVVSLAPSCAARTLASTFDLRSLKLRFQKNKQTKNKISLPRLRKVPLTSFFFHFLRFCFPLNKVVVFDYVACE